MSLPLEGIRVADFSRVIAGPICAMTLADLGADVVKIEHPTGGDDARGYRPPDYHGLSPAFLAYNRNKRSIALDLSQEDGRTTARALVDAADMVVENFSTGVMAKFDLDYDTVSAGRDDLIYCSTSAYGRTGPFLKRAGYDPVVQAESGFMSLTGEPEGEPLRTGMPMIDVTTGLTAAQAVLAALFHRRRTGRGQFIEAPLFDTGFSLTAMHAVGYMLDGTVPRHVGNADFHRHPVGLYACADGDVVIAAGDGEHWRALCRQVLERPDLLDDPRFRGPAGRLAHRADLDAEIATVLAGRPAAAVVETARRHGVPAGPVRTIADAMNSPSVQRRGNCVRSAHGDLGDAPNVAGPIRLSRSGSRPAEGAPLLGRHAEAVLSGWLGWDDDRIAALFASGATGQPTEAMR